MPASTKPRNIISSLFGHSSSSSPSAPRKSEKAKDSERTRRRALAQFLTDCELIHLTLRSNFQTVVNILSGVRSHEAPPSYEEAIKTPPYIFA